MTLPVHGFSEAYAPLLSPPRVGVSIDVLDRLLDSGRITLVELDRLVLPRKTLAHRRGLGVLTFEQSDRLNRLIRMIDEAEYTFGDPKKAHTWLRRPSRLLDGEAPLDRLDTDLGCRQIETLLGHIAHGIAA